MPCWRTRQVVAIFERMFGWVPQVVLWYLKQDLIWKKCINYSLMPRPQGFVTQFPHWQYQSGYDKIGSKKKHILYSGILLCYILVMCAYVWNMSLLKPEMVFMQHSNIPQVQQFSQSRVELLSFILWTEVFSCTSQAHQIKVYSYQINENLLGYRVRLRRLRESSRGLRRDTVFAILTSSSSSTRWTPYS